MEILAGNVGYQANNMIQETKEEINNLLDNINHDKAIVHHELANLMVQNKTLQQEIGELKEAIQKLILHGKRSTYQQGTTTNTPAQHSLTSEECIKKLKQRFNNCDAYCWSHGFTGSDMHTSSTCKGKFENHKDTANKTNMMGGNKEKLPGFWKAQQCKNS